MTEPTSLFPGVALVTGAAGTGIGNAIAHAFVSAGCRYLALTDINDALLNDTITQLRNAHPDVQIFSLAGDISAPSFVSTFHERALATFGRLDYCVNAAGVLGPNAASTDTSLADFDAVNAVNYRGAWLCSRAQLQAMSKQSPLPSHDPLRPAQRGSIVHIASQLGLVGRSNAPAYCASKAAVVALARADAIDYAGLGVRVNCVCPGVIETPMTVGSEETRERLRPAVEVAPMRRMGRPGEVADCAVFLSSTRASFVTGHAMVVDGGYIIN